MKKLSLIFFAAFWLGFFSLPILNTACTTSPDQRVQTVQTLKIVGQSAKASIDAAAQLLAHNEITVQQFDKVAKVYDTRFQPTYALAVTTAKSDLSSPASPALIGIAAEIATLVAQLTSK